MAGFLNFLGAAVINGNGLLEFSGIISPLDQYRGLKRSLFLELGESGLGGY